MAQALAQKRLGPHTIVESAGIDAASGCPPTQEAIEVMKEAGLDIQGHRSRNTDDLNLMQYDLIIALTSLIAEHVKDMYNVPGGRMLKFDIPDPYRKGITAYKTCVAQISDILDGLFPNQQEMSQ